LARGSNFGIAVSFFALRPGRPTRSAIVADHAVDLCDLAEQSKSDELAKSLGLVGNPVGRTPSFRGSHLLVTQLNQNAVSTSALIRVRHNVVRDTTLG
jgi:hypothetical protein